MSGGNGSTRAVSGAAQSIPALLPDSAHYSDHGRALLIYLGAIEPDPLRVEAERWLRSAERKTPATVAVRHALGPDVPEDWLRSAALARNTPWKGRLA